jgi:hypothetical protein
MALSKYNNACMLCLVNLTNSYKHSLRQCKFMLDYSDYIVWLNEIHYDLLTHVCYRCHVPQASKSLHKTFVPDDSACEYPGIVAPLGYGVWHSEKLRTRAQARFGVVWKDAAEYLNWMNGPIIDGHLSNLSAIFLWYAQEVDT